MDVKVIFDHKVVLALGVTAVGIIFASKLDPAAVKEVSIRAIGAAEVLHPLASGSVKPPDRQGA